MKRSSTQDREQILSFAGQLATEQNWADTFIDKIRRQPRILILGETGTGKTSMVRTMKKDLIHPIEHLDRTTEVETHHLSLAKRAFVLVDPPGEKDFRIRRIEAIREAIRKGYKGIINVVAYGYHEGREDLPKVFDTNNRIREDYLAEKRQQELDMLAEWTVMLGGEDSDAFLITVVTKADLWGNEQQSVLDYYRTGPYADALGDAKHLKPIVLPYCSVQKRFYDLWKGHIEDGDRIRLRANLLTQLFLAISGLPYSDSDPGNLSPSGLIAEDHLMAEYHQLVDKKLSRAITPEESRRLQEVKSKLDQAEPTFFVARGNSAFATSDDYNHYIDSIDKDIEKIERFLQEVERVAINTQKKPVLE